MCQAIFYQEEQHSWKIDFQQPQARLPVRLKTGGVIWLNWGRRLIQKGQLPLGGWARMESIMSGQWDPFFPKPVKIPAQGFVEVNFEGYPQYFKLVKGQSVQGLLARHDQELRVYIVTLTPERSDAAFPRWPKIIV